MIFYLFNLINCSINYYNNVGMSSLYCGNRIDSLLCDVKRKLPALKDALSRANTSGNTRDIRKILKSSHDLVCMTDPFNGFPRNKMAIAGHHAGHPLARIFYTAAWPLFGFHSFIAGYAAVIDYLEKVEPSTKSVVRNLKKYKLKHSRIAHRIALMTPFHEQAKDLLDDCIEIAVSLGVMKTLCECGACF